MDIEYRFRPSHQYGYFRSAHHLYTHSSDQGRPPSTKDCPFSPVAGLALFMASPGSGHRRSSMELVQFCCPVSSV